MLSITIIRDYYVQTLVNEASVLTAILEISVFQTLEELGNEDIREISCNVENAKHCNLTNVIYYNLLTYTPKLLQIL